MKLFNSTQNMDRKKAQNNAIKLAMYTWSHFSKDGKRPFQLIKITDFHYFNKDFGNFTK